MRSKGIAFLLATKVFAGQFLIGDAGQLAI
jgi:hypothetical protein